MSIIYQRKIRHLIFGLCLAILPGCHTAKAAQTDPATLDTSPLAANCSAGLTENGLDECIKGCSKSQYDHPEETPYDCRAVCCEGVMR
jgi:hypothetical protein